VTHARVPGTQGCHEREFQLLEAQRQLANTVDDPLFIALVESDDLIVQLLERWLSVAGHVTRTVPAALPVLHVEGPFDLVIADVASVAAATQRVAALRAAYAAPLLLMSARFRHGAVHSAAMAGQLGVDAVLPKPFTCDELLAAVAAAVRAGRSGSP
jgi:DNA-binding response OmpR family regulator